MLTKEELPDCPVVTTVQLVGNKWKLLILRNLLARPWRFNKMLRSFPGGPFRRHIQKLYSANFLPAFQAPPTLSPISR